MKTWINFKEDYKMNKYIIKTINNDEFILKLEGTFEEFVRDVSKSKSNAGRNTLIECKDETLVNIEHIVSIKRI